MKIKTIKQETCGPDGRHNTGLPGASRIIRSSLPNYS